MFESLTEKGVRKKKEVSTTNFKLLYEKIHAAGDEMDTRRTMGINKL